jgi:ABC-2 family transporter protein
VSCAPTTSHDGAASRGRACGSGVKPVSRVFAMAHADLLERTRRYAYLVTLLFTIYAAWSFLPPRTSHYVTLQMGGHRGVYNSAWVGTVVAIMASVFLSLAGFYIAKGSIERDRDSGVGQILAATPLRRIDYVLAKFVSHFLLLASMVGVLALVAFAMQWLRAESRAIVPLALLAPFALITLPVMALTAAITVVFEVVPGLRGGLGNFVYFFFWLFMLIGSSVGGRMHANPIDPLATSYVIRDMQATCALAFPSYVPERDAYSLGFNFQERAQHATTFLWHGYAWNAASVALRLGWVVAAAALASLASLYFDRFDDMRAKTTKSKRGKGSVKHAARAPEMAPAAAADGATHDGATATGVLAHASVVPAAGLTPPILSFRFLPMLRAELAILLKGQSRWWYAIAAVILVLSLTIPLAGVRAVVLPIAWIWPVLIWSPMGSRERRAGTDAVLFSAARPLRRQLPAAYLAGVALALLMGAGVAVRLMIAGDAGALLGFGAGALFIPGFALCAGIWSGGGKLFEILYLLLWYAGPLNHTAELDFMGSTTAGVSAGVPYVFLGVTAVLLVLACVGRARQLRG